MNINDQLLAALVLYGAPVLFVVLVVAAAGLPLPATLLLIAAGAFVEQGSLSFWQVLGLGVMAAVLGDQIGFWIGRRGGHHLAVRFSRWFGGEERLLQAEAATKRWGGLGVFFTRWLVSPLGPAVNLVCGATAYPWLMFLGFDLAGELVWVVLYVMLGRLFSDRVQALSTLLGNVVWALVGLVAVVVLGWTLVQHLRPAGSRRIQRVRPVPRPEHHESQSLK